MMKSGQFDPAQVPAVEQTSVKGKSWQHGTGTSIFQGNGKCAVKGKRKRRSIMEEDARSTMLDPSWETKGETPREGKTHVPEEDVVQFDSDLESERARNKWIVEYQPNRSKLRYLNEARVARGKVASIGLTNCTLQFAFVRKIKELFL